MQENLGYKNKRIQFRVTYDKLISEREKEDFISKNRAEINEIIESGYLFIDDREGQLYDCMFVDNTRWMAQNFCFKRNNKSENLKYRWDELNTIIPKGWRLPTNKDYYELVYKAEAIVAQAQGVDKLEIDSNNYEVYEMLQGDSILEFNSGSAVYGFADNYIPFWSAGKEFFYVYDGQNEFSYGVETVVRKYDQEAFVRFVQDV
ncbi:MAG: hypothetical protein N4A49_09620 [Marinifilaceae bacterium]|jgi:uncharacterized protein (TIGR02145 family)|nr:hypothetical protein [Marinifilaceae bacterium]